MSIPRGLLASKPGSHHIDAKWTPAATMPGFALVCLPPLRSVLPGCSQKTRPALAGLVANLLLGTGLDDLDRRAVLLESAGQLVGLLLREPGLDGLAGGIHESLG